MVNNWSVNGQDKVNKWWLYIIAGVWECLRTGSRPSHLTILGYDGNFAFENTAAGDRAFRNAAPSLWNDLSPDIRLSSTVNQFKHKLKTLAFHKICLYMQYFSIYYELCKAYWLNTHNIRSIKINYYFYYHHQEVVTCLNPGLKIQEDMLAISFIRFDLSCLLLN